MAWCMMATVCAHCLLLVSGSGSFLCLGARTKEMNASSFQYFGYTAAADSWWLGAPQLLTQEDAHTARVLLAVRTSMYTSLAEARNCLLDTRLLPWIRLDTMYLIQV